MSKQKTNTKKGTPEPVVVVHEKGNVQVLVKDKNAEGILRPLTPQEKDLHYPKLDKQKPKKVAKRLGLSEDDIIRFETDEHGEKAKSCGKKNSKKGGKKHKDGKVILDFLGLFAEADNAKPLLAILFAALIAKFTAFLPTAALKIRAIYFEDDSMLNAAIVMLKGINGLAKYVTHNFKIKRPIHLKGRRDAVGSVAVSTSPISYFGGSITLWSGKKKKLWLPLWNMAVAVESDLPDAIRALLAEWPSVLPIYFSSKASKSTKSIEFGRCAAAVDKKALKKAEKGIKPVRTLFDDFAGSMFAHPKEGKAMFDNMGEYLPSDRTKGGGAVIPSDEQMFYAAGLCLYEAFLNFLVEKNCIRVDKGHELLTTARDAVLPQATAKGTSEVIHLSGDWSDRAVFTSFLTAYLKDNTEHMSLEGMPCEADIVASIYNKGDQDFLVAPFKTVLPAYRDYLSTFGYSERWASDADFFRAAKKWGIKGLKKGSRENDPWRLAFYRKDTCRSTLNCLGFPVSELPEDVRAIIEQAKNAHSGDKEVR